MTDVPPPRDLDILTPYGQAAWQACLEAMEAVRASGKYEVLEMPLDDLAPFDAILRRVRDSRVILCEVKARWMSSEELFGKYRGRWLISLDKIEALRALGKFGRLDTAGLLYCMKDGEVLLKQFSTRDGSITAPYRATASTTQKTVNGQQIVRNNAYVELEHPEVFRAKAWPTKPWR